MNWTVKIAAAVHATIAFWGLSRALLLAVYDRLLTDLPSDPDGLLGDPLVPLAARTFTFTLIDDRGPIPYQLHFLFAVERRDDTSELHILGGRLTIEDTEEN